jgi:hypothetical protein
MTSLEVILNSTTSALGHSKAKGRNQNFLPVSFYVGKIHCLHKFLFDFAWIGLLQGEKVIW